MNRDWWAGLFFGGIIAMILVTTLMVWDLVVLAPLIYIGVLDIIMFIDAAIDDKKNRRKRK